MNMRKIAGLLALAVLLAALAGCGRQDGGDGFTPERFREQYNTLVQALGYDAYVLEAEDMTVGRSEFSAGVMSGLFTLTGTLSGGVIRTLRLDFTDATRQYTAEAEDPQEATVKVLFLEAMVLESLTEAYETADEDDVTDFLRETLLPAFTEVQRVGAFKLHAAFNNTAATDCTLSLEALD